MKNKIKLLSVVSILLIISTVFTGCNSSKKYANTPYKYIALSSNTSGMTKIIKIGADNSIIQKRTSLLSAIALGGFTNQPQWENNLIYAEASNSMTNGKFGIISIDPITLKAKKVPGEVGATSFFVDGETVYTGMAAPETSRITKSKITDSQKNLSKFPTLNLKGILSTIFVDENYLYAVCGKYNTPDNTFSADSSIMGITLNKINKESLEILEEYTIEGYTGCEIFLATDTDIYLLVSEIQPSSPPQIDGYKTHEQNKQLSVVCKFNKETKETTFIKLPFEDADYMAFSGNKLYVAGGGSPDDYYNSGYYTSFVEINPTTDQIERAINLPFFSFEHYVTDDLFVALDGMNIYEYNLKDMSLKSTIKLTDEKSKSYNSFVIKQ